MDTNTHETIGEMAALVETFRQLGEPNMGVMVKRWRAEYMHMAAGIEYYEASDEKNRNAVADLYRRLHLMEDDMERLDAELTPVEDEVVCQSCDDAPVESLLYDPVRHDTEDGEAMLEAYVSNLLSDVRREET